MIARNRHATVASSVFPLACLAVFAVAGCAPEAEPVAVNASVEALTSSFDVDYSYLSPSTGQTCMEAPELTSASRKAFEAMMQNVRIHGRVVATSEAMRECLWETMMYGQVTLPADGTFSAGAGGAPVLWGPYCVPGWDSSCTTAPLCATDPPCDSADLDCAGMDPFTAWTLPVADLDSYRRLQAHRVWIEGQGPQALDIKCDVARTRNLPDGGLVPDGGVIPAGGGGSTVCDSRGDYIDESVNYRFAEVIDGASIQLTGTPTAQRQRIQYLAAFTWHEGLHAKGYDHTANPNVSPPLLRQQVPHIYGACMWQLMSDSSANCSSNLNALATPLESCADGYLMVDGFQDGQSSSTCTCLPDPGAPRPEALASRDYRDLDAPPDAKLVIDSTGAIYRRDVNKTLYAYNEYRTPTPGWQVIATGVDRVMTGGPFLVYDSAGSVYRRGASRRFLPLQLDVVDDVRTVSTEYLGPTGTGLVVDDVGAIYRILGTRIQRQRVGESGWRDMTTPFAVTTLAAGSDRICATSSDRHIWCFHGEEQRWMDFGARSQIDELAVDQQGITYIVQNGNVFRHTSGTGWDTIWNGATVRMVHLLAGDRLFGLTAEGKVVEFFPEDSLWQPAHAAGTVAAGKWAAGAGRLILSVALGGLAADHAAFVREDADEGVPLHVALLDAAI